MYRVITNILKRFFKASTIYKYGFNWSPMYRRSTGRLVEVSDDLHYVKIQIKLSWKNRNYAGSLFGGSMLAATDPIYMIQLIQILGDDYVVWDKAVTANYKRPGKGVLSGDFVFSAEEITAIKKKVAENNEMDLIKTMELINAKDEVVAEFSKTIYVAQKAFYKEKLKLRQAETNH